MERILVPLDGSEFAERAVSSAVDLASRSGAELHLASIVSDLPPVPLASGDGDLVSRWFDEEKERAGQYLDGVRERLSAGSPALSVTTHVRLGPVTRSLEKICKELSINLVVMTTHGRGAWQRAWLGSVADQLLRSGAVPLLLIPEEGKEPGSQKSEAGFPGHAVVPLDGSEAAESVVDLLRPLLTTGTRVTLVSVLQQPFPLATTYLPHAVTEEALMKERRVKVDEYLEKARRRVAEHGLPEPDVKVLVGDDAARSLLEFVDAEDVDLIALSTRGRGGVSRFVMGSVADKLVRGSKVPLLTARRPAE